MQQQKITTEQFHKMFLPRHGLVLVHKDQPLEKTGGGLHLPQSVKDRQAAWGSTGKIVALSPFEAETDHDKYLYSLVSIGDRVAFDSSTPIEAGIPPHYMIENVDKTMDITVLIHVSDLTMFFHDTEEERGEFLARFDREEASRHYP